MQFTAPPAAILDVTPYADAVKFTSAESGVITDVAKRLGTLYGKMPKDANSTPLQRVKDAAHALGVDGFSDAAFERLRVACAMESGGTDQFNKRVKQAFADHSRMIEQDERLVPIATKLIDGIAAAVRDAAEKHGQAVASSPLATGISDHEAQSRVAATINWLEETRGKVIRDGAAWHVLQDFGKAPQLHELPS